MNPKRTWHGINLATRHTWVTKATRVTTFHDNYQRVELGSPYPSVIFHAKISIGSSWVARILSQYHPWSTVGCRLTHQLSKLLSLRDPWILYAPVHNQSCSSGSDGRSSINSGGGYHLQSSEYENIPLSIFPSGIFHFPLIAPLGLT
jgi:hypothetical protein